LIASGNEHRLGLAYCRSPKWILRSSPVRHDKGHNGVDFEKTLNVWIDWVAQRLSGL
jgi:hypothetical protein